MRLVGQKMRSLAVTGSTGEQQEINLYTTRHDEVHLLVSSLCWISCFSWLTCCMVLLRSTPWSLAECWAIFLSTSLRSNWKRKSSKVKKCVLLIKKTPKLCRYL